MVWTTENLLTLTSFPWNRRKLFVRFGVKQQKKGPECLWMLTIATNRIQFAVIWHSNEISCRSVLMPIGEVSEQILSVDTCNMLVIWHLQHRSNMIFNQIEGKWKLFVHVWMCDMCIVQCAYVGSNACLKGSNRIRITKWNWAKC